MVAHSWDCIEAFKKAAQEDSQNEGLLIRLEVKRVGLFPPYMMSDN